MVDVNELKETAVSQNFVGWTEYWEKEKWKMDGAFKKCGVPIILMVKNNMFFMQLQFFKQIFSYFCLYL